MKTQKYIAFLRAVNVGGRIAKMEQVRGLFEDLGFTGVRSYIQSGNIFFETTEKNTKAVRAALERKIEKKLEGALGYEVPVFLRTLEEVEAALALDPFAEVKVTPDTRLVILFTSEPLPKSIELPHTNPKGDATIVAATPGELFLVVDQSSGRPGNPAGWVEKTFKIKVTGRFFATTAKILAAAKKE